MPTQTLTQPIQRESVPIAGQYVSEAAYWEKYYEYPERSFEWNDGQLEEVPMSNYLQYALYRWFVALLEHYLQTHPVARSIALETGFQLTRAGGKRSIRKPDLGVVLNSNPVPLGDRDRSYHGVFDLCIESLSDSTRREVERDTVQKKGEYAQAGVREYFTIDVRRTTR